MAEYRREHQAGEDQPFPNKPVFHRKPSSRMQDPLELYGFEKNPISAQRKGPLSSPEDQQNEITLKSEYVTDHACSLTDREVQLAKAIHAKKLMLREKLWRTGEKLRRQKIQMDQGLQKAEDDVCSRRQDGKTENGLTEPALRRPDCVKQVRIKEHPTQVEWIKTIHKEGREGEDVNMKEKEGVEQAEERHQTKASADVDNGATQEMEKEKNGLPKVEDKQLESHAHPNRPQQEALGLTENPHTHLTQPCRICNRKFSQDRVHKHEQICQKLAQSNRGVFNTQLQRTKGSSLEKFIKSHGWSNTPHVSTSCTHEVAGGVSITRPVTISYMYGGDATHIHADTSSSNHSPRVL